MTSETDGRRARGDRTRAQILKSAVLIASTDGLEGLSLGKVATAAGVPKTTLQVLFKDRETLQIRTLEAGVELFTAGILGALQAAASPLGRLRALADAWFDLVQRKELPGGCLVTASAAEYRARAGALRDLVLRHRDQWRQLLLAAAREAQAEWQIRAEVDVRQLVFEIMAFQMAANVAINLEEGDFERARQAVGRLLDEATRGGG